MHHHHYAVYAQPPIHHVYHAGAAYYPHVASGGSWFMHMLLSSVVHAAIFHMLAPLFHFGFFGNLLVGAMVIAGVWWVARRLRYA